MRFIQKFIKNGTKPISKTFGDYFVTTIKQTDRPKVLYFLSMRLFRDQSDEGLINTLERIDITSLKELVKHFYNIKLQNLPKMLEKA